MIHPLMLRVRRRASAWYAQAIVIYRYLVLVTQRRTVLHYGNRCK